MRVSARALCLITAVLCLAAPAQASAACANTGLQPSAANMPQVRGAVLCLLNRERASRGLPRLRGHAKLRTAAERHSRAMRRQHFFDHVSPAGTTPVQRVRAAGYLSGAASWAVGENIAWGQQRLATPAQIMRAWMRSPGHRANILRRGFRHVGIGVVLGTPSGGAGGATYTTAFGKR